MSDQEESKQGGKCGQAPASSFGMQAPGPFAQRTHTIARKPAALCVCVCCASLFACPGGALLPPTPPLVAAPVSLRHVRNAAGREWGDELKEGQAEEDKVGWRGGVGGGGVLAAGWAAGEGVCGGGGCSGATWLVCLFVSMLITCCPS